MLLIESSTVAAAPTPVSDSRPPNSGKTTPLNYRIQPGDELELHIYALPNQDRSFQVRADGGFYHRILGEVQAAGRTLGELRVEIARKLARELQNPGFQLGLVSYAKGEVSVLGEVKNQGKFAVFYGATILDVVAQAGGLTDNADPDSATLLRGGRTTEIDLKPLGPGSPRPLPLQPEDIIYVHRGHRISVAGEVQKPGVYAVSRKSASPIAEALKAAGGAKPTGALNRLKVIRPSLPSALIVNFSGGQTAEVPPLQDGDSLFVPERQALLIGAGKPGPVPLPNEQMPLLEVLAVGGVGVVASGVGAAELDRVTVIRFKELSQPDPKRETYNVEDFFQDDKGLPVVLIRDGDLVYVPLKDPRPGIFDNPLGILNLIFLARSFFL